MDRASFRVAALAAAASLVIACADARADPGAAPELGGPGAGQSPPTTAPPIDASAIDASAPEAPPPEAPPPSATTAEEASLEQGAMGAQEGVEQQPADEGPPGVPSVQDQGPASPSGPQPTAVTSPGGPGEPAGRGGAPGQSVQPIGALAAGAPEPPTGAQSALALAPALGPIEPAPMGGVRAPSGGRPLGSGLEGVLADLERELRHVQAEIDDLRRRVDNGSPAPKSGLIRLRSSLEQIAPVLLALELRLGAAGRLDPRLRALQHQLRVRLAGARASAGELIAALRRSGERGHELRMLLRELESFCALKAELSSNAGAGAASAPPEPGADAAYTQLRPALAASPQHAAAVPLERRAAGRTATRPSRDRGGPDAPLPSSSTPGAATASPGGGVSTAGLSLLATRAIALAAPRLRVAIRLPADRPYAVVLAPLGRPG
jgi:hypothetical protein